MSTTLAENLIVNCTGLGSKALFNDPELMPLKGQLTILVPQSEITYSTSGGARAPVTPEAGFIHMMPRSDGIVLGGTSIRDDWSLTVNEDERQRDCRHAHRAVQLDARPGADLNDLGPGGLTPAWAQATPGLKPGVGGGKRPLIRLLFDQLVGGAIAVRALRLDANQRRPVAALRRLQRRRELERVAGDDAVVVIGGGDERGRIAGAGLQVVQRRVLDQVARTAPDPTPSRTRWPTACRR